MEAQGVIDEFPVAAEHSEGAANAPERRFIHVVRGNLHLVESRRNPLQSDPYAFVVHAGRLAKLHVHGLIGLHF